MIRFRFHRALLVVLLLCSAFSAEILAEDLSSSWKISLIDSAAGGQPDTDDTRWSQIDFPSDVSNQVTTQGQWVWLRRSVNIDPAAGIHTLRFGRLYSQADVFLDGKQARILRSIPGGPALYLLPAVESAGQHLLALRLQVKRGLPAGAESPVILTDLNRGYRDYYFSEIGSLTPGLLYIAVGFSLLALSRRLQNPLHRKTAAFYLLAGLVGAAGTPIILHWLPDAVSELFHSLMKSLCILIPIPLLFAAVEFLDRQEDRLQRTILRFALPVSALTGAVHFGFSVLRIDIISIWIHSIWFLILFPLWIGILIVILRQTATQLNAAGFILIAGMIYFLYAGTASLINGSFFRDTFAVSTLFYAPAVLTPFLVLFASFLLSERKSHRKHEQYDLLESELLQSRLFSNINDALGPPMLISLEKISSRLKPEQKKKTLVQLDQYEETLGNVLELGRLELLETPDEVARPIRAVDLLDELLSEADLSVSVHVSPDLLIETSRELLGSLIHRLIDFPGFTGFDHMDLIVTQDLSDRIHFRFLMHQRDRKQLQHIQDIMASRTNDPDGWWIEWNIILEIARILNGKLATKVLTGRYLSLDLSLPVVHSLKEKSGTNAPLTLTFLHTVGEMPAQQEKPGWKERIRKLLQKEIA